MHMRSKLLCFLARLFPAQITFLAEKTRVELNRAVNL